MVKPLRVYITGATGFVGRYVVAEALRAGHTVRAVVRPSSNGSFGDFDSEARLEVARVDLRSQAGLAESLEEVDVVIHLAAAKSGDFATQFAGTVVATENLLASMNASTRLVGVSTFSVYDYQSITKGTLIDERSPLDMEPARRDEYAQTKLIQEELYRKWAEPEDHKLVILRPGMIYGPDNLWHALLGAEFGPRFLRIGSKATLPLTYVENCATAMIRSAERLCDTTSAASVDGQTINIVDDDLPTQAEYAEMVQQHTDTPPSVFVPWPVLRSGAEAVQMANRVLLGGKAKFPGIAVPERLAARFKSLHYTNAKAKKLLGWNPAYGTAEAIRRSAEAEQSANRRHSSAQEIGSNPKLDAEP